MKRVETITLNMLYAGRCPILINRCYGAFSLSTKAKQAYNSECKPDNLLTDQTQQVARTDRLLAKIYTSLRDEANGQFAKLDVCWVEDRFEPYVNISEYNGYETATVDFQRYQMDSIKNIIEMHVSDTERIDRIQHVFAESEPTFIDEDGRIIDRTQDVIDEDNQIIDRMQHVFEEPELIDSST